MAVIENLERNFKKWKSLRQAYRVWEKAGIKNLSLSFTLYDKREGIQKQMV